MRMAVLLTSSKLDMLWDGRKSRRCGLRDLGLATLFASDTKLGYHDDSQDGVECKAEWIELDWNAHDRLLKRVT